MLDVRFEEIRGGQPGSQYPLLLLSLVVVAITWVFLSKGRVEGAQGCKTSKEHAQYEAGHLRLTSNRSRHQARGSLKSLSGAVTCWLGFFKFYHRFCRRIERWREIAMEKRWS